MKYYLITFFYLLSISLGFCQSKIFPIGAKWYYTKPYSESIKCVRLEIIKDTIINQDTCIIMEVSEINNSDSEIISHEYLKVNESKVFYYNQDSFYLLYDFNAKIGDTISVHQSKFKLRKGFLSEYLADSMDIFRYKILNVDSIKVGDDWLRRQTIERIDSWGWEFKNYILENIGAMDYFFGLFPGIITTDWVIPRLRCYSDGNISFTNQQWQDECDFTGSVIKLKPDNKNIKVFPNPVTSQLNIESYNVIKEVYIYSIKGQIVFHGNYNTDLIRINTTNLLSGIYKVSILCQNSFSELTLIK